MIHLPNLGKRCSQSSQNECSHYMVKIKLWGLDSLVIFILNMRTMRYNEIDFLYIWWENLLFNECKVKHQNMKKCISNWIRELLNGFTSYNIGIWNDLNKYSQIMYGFVFFKRETLYIVFRVYLWRYIVLLK